MITVTLLTSKGETCGFTCSGHADYDEEGRDIVCSAVSALTQTCVLGLSEVLKLQAAVSIDESDGIDCVLSRDTSRADQEKASLLFDTMAAGLRSIRGSYPKNLKICSREV